MMGDCRQFNDMLKNAIKHVASKEKKVCRIGGKSDELNPQVRVETFAIHPI